MCGPVEQEEDESVYECTKANRKKLKVAKKRGEKQATTLLIL